MKNPFLNDVTVAVTNRCQLRCLACGIWKERANREISGARFVRMMEELLSLYQIGFVSVTGGEPFLHPGIGGILRYLTMVRAKGRINGVGIYTNGASPAIIKKVLEADPIVRKGLSVGISVDGMEKVHDALRGHGAWQRTRNTLTWLASPAGEGIDREVKFTISRENYGELEQVHAMARQFGARFSPKIMEHDVRAYYHRGSVPGVKKLSSLTPVMVRSVKEQLDRIVRAGGKGVNKKMLAAVVELLASGKKAITGCRTPQRSLFITSSGDVYPCLYMSSAGKIGVRGELPAALDRSRALLGKKASDGKCPRCFAYHGFLRWFNLKYLQQ